MSIPWHKCWFGVGVERIDSSPLGSVASNHVVAINSTLIKQEWPRGVESWGVFVQSRCLGTGTGGLLYLEMEGGVEAWPSHELTALVSATRAARPGKRVILAGVPFVDMDLIRLDSTKALNDAAAPAINIAEGVGPYFYHPGWPDTAFNYRDSCRAFMDESFRASRGRAVVAFVMPTTEEHTRSMLEETSRAVDGRTIGGRALFYQSASEADADLLQAWINMVGKIWSEA